MKSDESTGKVKKIIIIVIVAVIICGIIAGIVLYPKLNNNTTKDDILYNKITVFVNDERVSQTKEYTADEFPGLDIEKIVPYYNDDNKITIYLNTTSYEDMEKAMISLRNNPIVYGFNIDELFTKDTDNIANNIKNMGMEDAEYNMLVVFVSEKRAKQNKAYTIDEFPGIDIDRIRQVGAVKSGSDFIYIYVNTNTYDEIIDAKNKLKKNPIVVNAHIVGLGSIDN